MMKFSKRLKEIERHTHRVEDVFGDSVPHIHLPHSNFSCLINKITDESESYKNLTRLVRCLSDYFMYVTTCDCEQCVACDINCVFTREYLQHAAEKSIKYNIGVLKCLYKYIGKYINHDNIINIIRGCVLWRLTWEPDMVFDEYFWFFDICDKKDIKFMDFIVTFCFLKNLTPNTLEGVLERYSAHVYKNDKIIINAVNEFGAHLKVFKIYDYNPTEFTNNCRRMMSVLRMICNYSNKKYTYIDDTYDKYNKFLENLSKVDNEDIFGIILRDFGENIRFIILTNISHNCLNIEKSIN